MKRFLAPALLALLACGCGVDWNADLVDVLEEEAYSTYTFYGDNPDDPVFALDGGVPSASFRYKIGSELGAEALPSASSSDEVYSWKKGYEVAGWAYYGNPLDGGTNLPSTMKAEGGVITAVTVTPQPAALYASGWTAVTYYVAFDANGGEGSMERMALVYDAAAALTANAFSREGYSFSGWNARADGSGTSYEDGQEVRNLADRADAVVTLYAQWEETSGWISVAQPETAYNDLSLHHVQDNDDGTKTFGAAEGYSSYTWYIDGAKIAETGTTAACTFDGTRYDVGVHYMLVTATDAAGSYYSSRMSFWISR